MKNRFITILILFLMILAQIGTDVYLPSFPEIKAQFITTNALVQLTFSVFLLGFALSQLIYGPLADRYGRKFPLLTGVFIYFIMSLVAAITSSIEILLIARALQGVGAGACSVIPRAIMSDRFSGIALQKMTIYQAMVWSIIPISAPLIGSYIQHYLGWRFNFLLLSFISLTALIMCLFFKETYVPQEKKLSVKKILKDYRQIFFHQRLLCYLICATCVIGLVTLFNVSAPLFLRETLHLSAIQYGWSIFTVAISFIIGTIINRKLLTSKSSLTIAWYGVVLTWIAGFLLLIFSFTNYLHLMELLIPIFIMQIGCALIFPSCAAKIMEFFPHMAGKIAAIFGFSISFGSMLASIIAALLPVHTLVPLAVVIASLNIVIFIFYRIIHNNEVTYERYTNDPTTCRDWT